MSMDSNVYGLPASISTMQQCNTSIDTFCIDECLKYSDVSCRGNLAGLHLSDNQLDEKLILDCSDPFRVFDSIHVDTEKCYNFTCKLIQYTGILKI